MPTENNVVYHFAQNNCIFRMFLNELKEVEEEEFR